MKFFFAPIQGYTDALYRNLHARFYMPADVYCAPFMHIEHGEPRRRDMRDITSPLNDNITLLPQILFKDIDEFNVLASAITNSGYNAIDLNMGCPFQPQIRKGRGASMITDLECLKNISKYMSEHPEISFSIKMRLGVNSEDEWQKSIGIINDMPLRHLTIHPRIARQQYSGELFMDEFDKIYSRLNHPLIFNGDLTTVESINSITSHYPELHGVMVGRGLLARPTLIEEWRTNAEISRAEQIERLLTMHAELLANYESALCGDTQILAKIKTFWEYPAELIGRKCAKLIKKAGSLNAYKSAIATIADTQ
ncbi:MAG: tRNA-dihydrouridine synthase family protein [Muribaculum sp.]|nr:tRNA-dihydrouridine synthase family protein [Muribaculum sp.]